MTLANPGLVGSSKLLVWLGPAGYDRAVVGHIQAEHSFPTTDWALLARARSTGGADGQESMESVINRYVPALRRYLRRVKRLDDERTSDVLQGFVADKVLSRLVLRRAEERRGRFRNLLIQALENYLIDLYRRDEARQPESGPARSLDRITEDVADGRSHDCLTAFEVEWAKTMLTDAVSRTYDHCQRQSRMDLWRVFEGRILAPAADGVAPVPYKRLCEQLGLASPIEAARALFSAKRIFIRKLQQVLVEHAEPGAEPDIELTELRKIFSRAAEICPHDA